MRERLTLRKNRSLWSRIHTRLSLGAAEPGDTAGYVSFRLKRAAADREHFSTDALGLIHEASQGALRDIDRIATACLKLAAKRKLRVIDRELVARIQQAEAVLDDTEYGSARRRLANHINQLARFGLNRPPRLQQLRPRP